MRYQMLLCSLHGFNKLFAPVLFLVENGGKWDMRKWEMGPPHLFLDGHGKWEMGK